MASPSRKRKTRAILCASPPVISTVAPGATASSMKNRLLRTERILHAFEERAVVDCIAAGNGIGLERFLLLLVEFGRHGDVHRHVMVAAMRTANARHAGAAHPHRRPGLRSGR